MTESKYPEAFTREWWDLRNQFVSQIAEQQKRRGTKWTAEETQKSKRDEYAAVHGREADQDEQYAKDNQWWDT